jgi:Ca2+ transporting ATPase
VVHLFVEKLIKGEPIEWSILYNFLEFFIVGVTIIVVAIPEGLPLAVTIALAYSVGKMKDENNLVRYLSACETMGGANNVCTDKTGTLTQNKMSVKELYIGEDINNLENPKDISEELAHRYSEAVCANSTARPEKSEDGAWKQVGNKTECALIELANKFDCDYQNYRDSDNNLRIVPFSSKRKMMSTVWKDEKNNTYIYCKGASEMILEKVTKVMTADGQEKPLDENGKNQIKEEVIGKFAKEALRTIGIGFKKLESPGNVESIPEDQLESDLTLVAIAGIMDPLRPEIPDAVETCKKAGITVRMVTGDNTETAMSIARNAGILAHDFELREGSNAVMEGKVFRQKVGGLVETQNKDGDKVMQVKNLDAFKEIEKELRVLARSSPEDKYILVTGLKQLENVVAVTGDGTNDAPALKKADIGFAMLLKVQKLPKKPLVLSFWMITSPVSSLL